MVDLNFNKIIKKLQDIHKEYPDIKFGEVIQRAIDEHKRIPNNDLHSVSSKSMLTALESFEVKTQKRRTRGLSK